MFNIFKYLKSIVFITLITIVLLFIFSGCNILSYKGVSEGKKENSYETTETIAKENENISNNQYISSSLIQNKWQISLKYFTRDDNSEKHEGYDIVFFHFVIKNTTNQIEKISASDLNISINLVSSDGYEYDMSPIELVDSNGYNYLSDYGIASKTGIAYVPPDYKIVCYTYSEVPKTAKNLSILFNDEENNKISFPLNENFDENINCFAYKDVFNIGEISKIENYMEIKPFSVAPVFFPDNLAFNGIYISCKIKNNYGHDILKEDVIFQLVDSNGIYYQLNDYNLVSQETIAPGLEKIWTLYFELDYSIANAQLIILINDKSSEYNTKWCIYNIERDDLETGEETVFNIIETIENFIEIIPEDLAKSDETNLRNILTGKALEDAEDFISKLKSGISHFVVSPDPADGGSYEIYYCYLADENIAYASVSENYSIIKGEDMAYWGRMDYGSCNYKLKKINDEWLIEDIETSFSDNPSYDYYHVLNIGVLQRQ